MSIAVRGRSDLIMALKPLAIGSIALGALLLFNPLISSISILFASVLEAVIDVKSINLKKRIYLNTLFPITSAALITLALISSILSRTIGLLALSAILAGFRAWSYVGFKLKTLMISGAVIAVIGCLGLLFIPQPSSLNAGVTISLSVESVIYELILSAPWSTLVLTGLVIYSSTMIYMLKYIRSEKSANVS